MFSRIAERLRHMTPAQAVALFPWSLGLASVLSIAVLVAQSVLQNRSDYYVMLMSWSLITLIVAGALATASNRDAFFVLPASVDPTSVKAYALAVQIGLILLVVPVFLRVWITYYEFVPMWSLPFLNKRWLVALYGLGIATFLVFPSVLYRLSTPPAASPDSVRAEPSPKRMPRRRWQMAASLLVLGGLAWYWAGPPWHLDRRHSVIDFHEQVHLGPLQAMDKGYLPFIGPASTQYGPGSQVLTYGLMKAAGHFDIVSFRNANATFHFVSVLIVGGVAFFTMGFWPALLVLLLAFTYSPLAFYAISGTSLGGMFGWANAFRYLAPLVIVPALGRLVSRDHPRAKWPAIALGVVWGMMAWISQENLSSTLVASALLLAVLWATETASTRAVVAVAGRMLLGFVVWWIPLLAYYALHGSAAEFIRNYLLVARAVAMGFSNSWWEEGAGHAHTNIYYYTPVLLIIIGICTLCDVPRVALRTRLNGRQIRLLTFVFVLLASYQTALYRSDSTHLMNTMIALPFVLVAGFIDLSSWAVRAWPARVAFRAVFVAVALYVFPLAPVFTDLYGRYILLPMARLNTTPAEETAQKDGRVAFVRATRYLSDEPLLVAGTGPMRPFLEAASELHGLIGERRTYIDGPIAGVYTGLYYFLADLVPGPYLLDKETMVINPLIADEAFYHFSEHVREFECVIALSLEAREVKVFLQAHPGAGVVERFINGQPFFVILTKSTTD